MSGAVGGWRRGDAVGPSGLRLAGPWPVWALVGLLGLGCLIAACTGTWTVPLLPPSPPGTVWFWGGSWGDYGNCCGVHLLPGQVSGVGSIIAVSAGSDHGMALRSDGTVWTWGYGWYGQLGDGMQSSSRSAPGQVTAPLNCMPVWEEGGACGV